MKWLKNKVLKWLMPEMLGEIRADWICRAYDAFDVLKAEEGQKLAENDAKTKALSARVGVLESKFEVLRLADHVRLDWAKELSKTMDVIGTPSRP